MKNVLVIIVCLFGLNLASQAQCNRFLNYDSGSQVGYSLAISETYCGENLAMVQTTYNQYTGYGSIVCYEYATGVWEAYWFWRQTSSGACGSGPGGGGNGGTPTPPCGPGCTPEG